MRAALEVHPDEYAHQDGERRHTGGGCPPGQGVAAPAGGICRCRHFSCDQFADSRIQILRGRNLREFARKAPHQDFDLRVKGMGHDSPSCATRLIGELDQFERGEPQGEQGARAMQARAHGSDRATEDVRDGGIWQLFEITQRNDFAVLQR